MAYLDTNMTIRPWSGSLDASSSTNGIVDSKVFQFPTLPTTSFKAGTGNLQINLMTKLTFGSLASTTVLIDLTTLTDEFGTAINFARAKGILLLNFATTAGFILKAGGAGTNPWAAPFGTTTDKIIVPNGCFASDGTTIIPGQVVVIAPAAAGLVTSGTSKVLQLDSGSNTVAYGYAIIGADA